VKKNLLALLVFTVFCLRGSEKQIEIELQNSQIGTLPLWKEVEEKDSGDWPCNTLKRQMCMTWFLQTQNKKDVKKNDETLLVSWIEQTKKELPKLAQLLKTNIELHGRTTPMCNFYQGGIYNIIYLKQQINKCSILTRKEKNAIINPLNKSYTTIRKLVDEFGTHSFLIGNNDLNCSLVQLKKNHPLGWFNRKIRRPLIKHLSFSCNINKQEDEFKKLPEEPKGLDLEEEENKYVKSKSFGEQKKELLEIIEKKLDTTYKKRKKRRRKKKKTTSEVINIYEPKNQSYVRKKE